jgi:hypothetical protein
VKQNGRNHRPAFLITVDSEGDNLWARPTAITTKNASYLPRFQSLCEKYGMRPTYLTNWEMAVWPPFQELGRAVIAAGTGEIGMHLHAWNSPPAAPLTDNDYRHHPYLIEYPRQVLREKVRLMTGTLEDVFGTKIVSHRAGRWGFNETYAQVLIECDYRVDCTVTPHVSWRACKGDPEGPGGTDYSGFPQEAYFINPDDISKPGSSPLLEVPLTVSRTPRAGLIPRAVQILGSANHLAERVARRLFPPDARLMPNGRNGEAMLWLLDTAIKDGRDYVEFMVHSSELMPGGSPTFITQGSIGRLYRDIELLFAHASQRFQGQTLREYYNRLSIFGSHET